MFDLNRSRRSCDTLCITYTCTGTQTYIHARTRREKTFLKNDSFILKAFSSLQCFLYEEAIFLHEEILNKNSCYKESFVWVYIYFLNFVKILLFSVYIAINLMKRIDTNVYWAWANKVFLTGYWQQLENLSTAWIN